MAYSREYYLANKEKALAASRAWRNNNREKFREYTREYNKKWNAANPEKASATAKRARERQLTNDPLYYSKQNETSRKWISANRPRVNGYLRNWYRANPDKSALQNKQRRTTLLMAQPPWFDRDKVKALYLKRDELNHLWNLKGKDRLVVDHIIPISPADNSVCGLHCWENLQLLSSTLNAQKNDSYETDWSNS